MAAGSEIGEVASVVEFAFPGFRLPYFKQVATEQIMSADACSEPVGGGQRVDGLAEGLLSLWIMLVHCLKDAAKRHCRLRLPDSIAHLPGCLRLFDIAQRLIVMFLFQFYTGKRTGNDGDEIGPFFALSLALCRVFSRLFESVLPLIKHGAQLLAGLRQVALRLFDKADLAEKQSFALLLPYRAIEDAGIAGMFKGDAQLPCLLYRADSAVSGPVRKLTGNQ